MAEIHPFHAILYRPGEGQDITPFVAPPYDVIDASGRAMLAGRDPHNVVQLTLPEAPEGADPYEEAARLFRAWTGEGVLQSRDTPALYVWEQEFRLGETTYNRRALVARVTCEPYRSGGVMRHEHTHRGPKEDRLKLFRATSVQFSQLFGIFPDGGGAAAALLDEAAGPEPLRTARGDDGHSSRLYGITNEQAIGRLQAILRGCTVTMADGHHRYETSVAYYQEQGRVGSTLMTLVPASDPGLMVLPTHRTIRLNLDGQAFREGLGDEFSVDAYSLDDWPGLYQKAADQPSLGMVVAVAPQTGQAFQVGWKDDGARRLSDVEVLHERILPPIVASGTVKTEHFGYFHDADGAVRAAAADGRWAFLLRPTSVETLLQVVEQQKVLPSKSTYFFPKFLAGFINARLD